MRAGQLRCRIAVDEPVETQDSTGDPVVSWVTRATVWGSIDPLRSREGVVASQTLVNVDSKITLRWGPMTSSITEKWRLRSRGVTYNIVNMTNVQGRNRAVELICKSGRDEG